MILYGCPYSNAAGNTIAKAELGMQNLVALHQCNYDFVDYHTAPLSVKYVAEGREVYQCEKHPLSVDHNNYLIINKDQSYSSFIDERNTTQSLCIFFSDRFVQSAFLDSMKSNEYLLDNINEEGSELFFHQKLYRKDEGIDRLIKNFVNVLQQENKTDGLLIDQWCTDIMTSLLIEHHDQQRKATRIRTAKKSTQREIYKRLNYSIDYIHEYFSASVSLNQLADIACLSPYHYHRLFKEAFETTPYEYIRKLRLEQACYLLKHSDTGIAEIGALCGTDNESSFSRMFRKQIGITPSEYRKTHF